MKKVMRIAAIALFIAGSSVFACDAAKDSEKESADKTACSESKKSDKDSTEKMACSGSKKSDKDWSEKAA